MKIKLPKLSPKQIEILTWVAIGLVGFLLYKAFKAAQAASERAKKAKESRQAQDEIFREIQVDPASVGGLELSASRKAYVESFVTPAYDYLNGFEAWTGGSSGSVLTDILVLNDYELAYFLDRFDKAHGTNFADQLDAAWLYFDSADDELYNRLIAQKFYTKLSTGLHAKSYLNLYQNTLKS